MAKSKIEKEVESKMHEKKEMGKKHATSKKCPTCGKNY